MADTDMLIEDELGDVAHLLKTAEELVAHIASNPVVRVAVHEAAVQVMLAQARFVVARVRSRLPKEWAEADAAKAAIERGAR